MTTASAPDGLTVRREGTSLVITQRASASRRLWAALILLVGVALLAGAWVVEFALWGSTLVAVLLGFASMGALGLAWLPLTLLANRLEIHVSDEALSVRHRPFETYWPSQAPRDAVHQLSSLPAPSTWWRGGKHEVSGLLFEARGHSVLVEGLDSAELAAFVARAIAERWSLPVAPIHQEVTSGRTTRQVGWLIWSAAVVIASGVIMGLAIVDGGGEELGTVAVADEPQSVQIEIGEGTPYLAFFLDVHIKESVKYLPRYFDVEIEVLRDGEVVWSKRCDPSSYHVSKGRTRGFDGTEEKVKLDGCLFEEAEPGTYSVRTRRIWLEPERRGSVKHLVLCPTAYDREAAARD